MLAPVKGSLFGRNTILFSSYYNSFRQLIRLNGEEYIGSMIARLAREFTEKKNVFMHFVRKKKKKIFIPPVESCMNGKFQWVE